MAVVAPEERPAAASITAVPKTFAWAAGSIISGYLLTLSSFGWPLLIGGVIKGVYDILLLIKFQKVRPPERPEPPPIDIAARACVVFGIPTVLLRQRLPGEIGTLLLINSAR